MSEATAHVENTEGPTSSETDTKCDNEKADQEELKSGKEEGNAGNEVSEKLKSDTEDNDGLGTTNEENSTLEKEQTVVNIAIEAETCANPGDSDSNAQEIVAEETSNEDLPPIQIPDVNKKEPGKLEAENKKAEDETKTEEENNGTKPNSKQAAEHQVDGEIEVSTETTGIQKESQDKSDLNTASDEKVAETFSEDLNLEETNDKQAEKTEIQQQQESSPDSREEAALLSNTSTTLEEKDSSALESQDKTDEEYQSGVKQLPSPEVKSDEIPVKNVDPCKDHLDEPEKSVDETLEHKSEKQASQQNDGETIANQPDKTDTTELESEAEISEKKKEQESFASETEQLPIKVQNTKENLVKEHVEETTENQQDKQPEDTEPEERGQQRVEEQQPQVAENLLETPTKELEKENDAFENKQLAIESVEEIQTKVSANLDRQESNIDENKSAELTEKEKIENSIEQETKVNESEQSIEIPENSDTNSLKTIDNPAPEESAIEEDMDKKNKQTKESTKTVNEIVAVIEIDNPAPEVSAIEEDMDKKNKQTKESTKTVDEIVAVIEIDDDNEDSVVKQADSEKTDAPKPVETETEHTKVANDNVTKPTVDVIEIDDDDDDDTDPGALKIDETRESTDEKSTKSASAEEPNSTTIADQAAEQASKEENSKSNDGAVARMHTMPMIFYKKECINFECPKTHKEFHRAPQFALNYFKISKKKMKIQYICGDCYDLTLNFYQEFCGILQAKQPLLIKTIANKKQEFVEILDSSDEDESEAVDSEHKDQENPSFSQADLDLIEAELEDTIKNVFDKVEIQNQLTWSKTIFTERVKKLQEELEYIDAELSETQKMADRMHNDLYDSGKYRINSLKALDLDCDTEQIPPLGEVERPPIKIGAIYYAARNKAIGCWVPCKVNEQSDNYLFVPHYRIKFIHAQSQLFKNISAKLLAYYEAPTVRLAVGQRVIAYFDGSTLSSTDKEKNLVKSAFYPGIIAEEMKPNNFYRYLIFYDDGYTQYVSYKDVRLVCHVARNVWEDVDHVSREFIKKYVQEYRVNRPMVQTHKGQKMTTEKNGRWVPARVIDIDCSLVRMQFEGPKGNHTEWIYRGSLRLNPVFMEYQKSKNQANRSPISRLPRRTEPFIRYTDDEENLSTQQQQQQQQAQTSRTLNRSNSTSSTTSSTLTVRHLNANTIYLEDEKPKGKVIYYTAKRQMPSRVFRRHECDTHCLLVVPHNLNGYNPLAKPLLSGWERLFSRQKIKKTVYYRAPCGKMFRNMRELHHYLRLTKCPLNVDNFDFYAETSCLAEFEAENVHLKKRDISNGQEKLPLPLINYYDDTLPECKYSAKVIPTEGVNINTDANFLICCDCEDDCVDKSKCACWRLTIEGVKTTMPDAQIDDIGYQYKRLYDHLPTGIYECNSRCKCKSHCLNRVVQHSLGLKLQVFKTTNRGWGLRCLNDIPQGSFVCVYAGNLLTEAKANEGGLDAGDEYFAELDYIETVEQLKEGYESDVEAPEEDDEDSYEPEPEDDVDFHPSRSTERRVRRGTASGGAINEGERQAINFNPKVAMEEDSKKKRISVRQLFGKDEAVYVMDAKVTGNLGRYFNHSCAPNLFVQNVFVDTHDIRFPSVAFFSLNHIRAGTELTWNYNYEVGVVPGKVLYCQCGAPNCRQRLL